MTSVGAREMPPVYPPADVDREAAAKADREGTTLNNVVKEALAAYV